MNKHEANRVAHDELDDLLRRWHAENAQRAAAGRDLLLARLRTADAPADAWAFEPQSAGIAARRIAARELAARLGRVIRRPAFRAAASLFLLITLLAALIPISSRRAVAGPDVLMAPEGGRLEAVDDRGNIIGPCALQRTDVVADIAGPFSRITLTQQYHNPYQRKIEAVYTFPLSHRAAVDRMTMTVQVAGEPDRIVEAEVKERAEARQIYQAARQAGYVASLLEQERPNIFTQSVANIEPGAQVRIEISYVEMLQQREGEYLFDFPMTVAPRYIPGSPTISPSLLPAELKARHGVILRGPAQLTLGQAGDAVPDLPSLQPGKLQALLHAAQPIEYPGAKNWWGRGAEAKIPPVWYPFEAVYCDGSREMGIVLADGAGQINNRWFYFDPDPAKIAAMGAGYEADTNRVPDASRITPMPVRPPTRAGHDISLRVNIDAGQGGPRIIHVESDLHAITRESRDGGARMTIALERGREIPNRDFVLRWRCESDGIREAVFAHAHEKWIDAFEVPLLLQEGADPAAAPKTTLRSGGGFFTAVIAPPARVSDADVLPRELIFVLDSSGSMSGQPIDKAKDVMSRAIDAMRAGDAFNMITFSGDTRILWDRPRPATPANRAEAQQFLAMHSGGGGTEMMKAIDAALRPTPPVDLGDGERRALTPLALANLPADGREVVVALDAKAVESADDPNPSIDSILVPVNSRIAIRGRFVNNTKPWLPSVEDASGAVRMRGRWKTIDGERVLEIEQVLAPPAAAAADGAGPLRIVMFLTDGLVGNDDAIINAVREHARTTRVFAFGIGDSPNRYLLDGMAQAGRGEVEYVNLSSDADASVQRFVRRIAAPVLRDITIELGEQLQVFDTVPALDAIPDLWDVKPLIVHGRYHIAPPAADGQPVAGNAARGTLTVRGRTSQGEYRREIEVVLPQRAEAHSMLPALWARGRIDQALAADEGVRRSGMVQQASADARNAIVALGTRYSIASAFTSFVAIEKTRVTVGGQSVLVPVPIEYPEGMEWEGVFGEELREAEGRELVRRERANGYVMELMHSRGDALAKELNAILAERFENAPRLDLGSSLEQGHSAQATADLSLFMDGQDAPFVAGTKIEFPWQNAQPGAAGPVVGETLATESAGRRLAVDPHTFRLMPAATRDGYAPIGVAAEGKALIDALSEIGRTTAMAFDPGERTASSFGVEPDRSLIATILRVERVNGQALVEIDVGSRDGVQKDWLMTAGSNDGRFLGNVRIINVDVNRATGLLELEQEPGAVQTGDKVVAAPPGAGFEQQATQPEVTPEAGEHAALAELKRQARLRRVIDQRLWSAVGITRDGTPPALAPAPPPASQTAPPSPAAAARPVIVLVHNAGDELAMAQMLALGLRVDDVNRRLNIIAGAIEPDAIIGLAQLEFVRRIEPIALRR